MPIEPFNWQCPHCRSSQTVTSVNYSNHRARYHVGACSDGIIGYETLAISCQNPDCLRIVIGMRVGRITVYGDETFRAFSDEDSLFSGPLFPRGLSKPQPNYIPAPLIEDYEEACAIVLESPKAAATLVRRCLQGMIRDFAGIAKATLNQEIDALKKAVDDGSADRSIAPETVEAIDHVRKIGNIGAHMEKDINLIVPVDPDEAKQLIALVEMLFEEWYVARHTRQLKLSQIANLASAKEGARKPKEQ